MWHEAKSRTLFTAWSKYARHKGALRRAGEDADSDDDDVSLGLDATEADVPQVRSECLLLFVGSSSPIQSCAALSRLSEPLFGPSPLTT
jgi:hypothetical protein